jgi:hypothetical protein
MPVRWQVEVFQAIAFSLLVYAKEPAPSGLSSQEKPLLNREVKMH